MIKLVRNFASFALVTALLSGCNTATNVVQDVSSMASVASALDSGITVPAKDLGQACEVVALTVDLASALEAAKAIGGSSVTAAISIGQALVSNPACVAAVAGKSISDPIVLAADIVQFVVAIRTATGGRISAVTAATSSNQHAPALHSLLRRASLVRHH